MCNRFWLALTMIAGIAAESLPAGTLQYEVTPVSGNVFQFTYLANGFVFAAHEELDVQFDPALYGILSNGVAPAGFNVTLLQTNNPPGVPGDYTALATINNPSSGSFSVWAEYLGQGQPGAQPFSLNLFNSDGFFVTSVVSGTTISESPEPSTFSLIFVALLVSILWTLRGRFSGRRCSGITTYAAAGMEADMQKNNCDRYPVRL